MALKIYSYPGNYRVQKAKIAAAYNGVEIEEPQFEFGKDNKSSSFLSWNPLGKVPVLETPDGPVWESNAIARYVARLRADTHLLGKSFYETALIDQWIDFSTTELEPARALWLYPIMGIIQYNEAAYHEAKKDMSKALAVLDAHLIRHTFLVGNQVTLADIVITAALVQPYTTVFAPDYISQFPNVTRWFTTIINQPNVAKVIGKVEFAKAEQKADKGKGDKKAKGSKKEEAPKEDKKEAKQEKKAKGSKKDKPAKEPKEQAKPKKEEPKPQEEEEDDPAAAEAAEAAKKQKQHPLLSLPKSTMDLDSTKRLFFAKLPYNPDFWGEFWPTLDTEGFSFWSMTYNYDDENTVYFQSQNHLGGFLQRADECRKFAFGVAFLYGTDEDTPPFRTAGCWLFRGQDLTPEMKEHPSAEYFTWTKMSTGSHDDKATIENFFIGEKFKGFNILDRRYLK